MRSGLGIWLAVGLFSFFAPLRGAGQVSAAPSGGQGCSLTQPSFSSDAPNIFNDRQEQDLGDALAELGEPQMHLVPPLPDDQLTRIGEKLVATLPPTGVRYHFRIYESRDVNGFAPGGGRVYISRKLISRVKNEDQLAGVIAHEIGHNATHQAAIQFTRMFRIRLGVTAVTDRADIFAKVQRFFSTPRRLVELEDTQLRDQLDADRVGLYAMVRAGYAPESFASFMNESWENQGKTGNRLSDILGITGEASQRYRTALKLIDTLPAGCSQRTPQSTDAFTAWQKSVMEERGTAVAEDAEGDRPLDLEAKLRPNLSRIRFSLDGRYVLGQDESGIAVVDRNSWKLLFHIDAPDANEADFTLDSQDVVFDDPELRVEKWNIASATRTLLKEVVVRSGCRESRLTPDGRTLVCVSIVMSDRLPNVTLKLIDVESGATVLDKPSFFSPGPLLERDRLIRMARDRTKGLHLAAMSLSPDERTLLVASGTSVLAFNLEDRQAIALGLGLKGLNLQRMAFLAPDQLFVAGAAKGNGMYEADVLSFPEGKLLKKMEIGKQSVDSATKGGYLKTEPLKEYAVGLLDPADFKYKAVAMSAAMDAWSPYVALESLGGDLQLGQTGVAESRQLALPGGELPAPRAGDFSADGKYLAVSLRGRAAVWDLETGKQMALFRPFRTGWFDEQDRLLTEFPKFLNKEASAAMMTLLPMKLTELGEADEDQSQYRGMQFRFKPMGKDKIAKHNATLEAQSIETQKVAWSREFPHETPNCWSAEDNRVVLAWDLNNVASREEIKGNATLRREISTFKDSSKGVLLETVNLDTGAPLEQVVVPEADLTGGANDERRAQVSGEFVLVRGEHGNTEIYRLDTGAKVGEFFGSPVATDAGLNLIAAVNRADEILLVDERDGKELQRFTLGSPVRLARIVTGGQKTLLVLTADQVVHRLPLPE